MSQIFTDWPLTKIRIQRIMMTVITSTMMKAVPIIRMIMLILMIK